MTKKDKTLKVKDTEPALSARIIEETNYRTKLNIDDWRVYISEAENVERQNLLGLYNLYREIDLDAHIHGLIQQRLNALLGSAFRIVNEAGEEQTDAWKLFETAWFHKFLELAMGSRWWHHALIQLWDKTDNGYATVNLVNRNHVLPRLGQVTIRQNDTTSAINYREPQYFDWLVEVGDPEDLGLFNKAAPNYLIKKNGLLEWSKYAQLFGAPFRFATIGSKNPKDINQVAENLRKMAFASFGVFPEGTEIKLLETNKTDAYQLYLQLVTFPNSENSKLFLGQTMTTDNGSSKSQGEVHERVAEGIAEADKRFIQFVVNDQLIPKMIKHGFKLQGMRFEWSPVKDLTKLMDMATKLLPFKNIKNDWLEENFGIPVEDKPQTEQQVPPVPPAPVKKKQKLSLSAELVLLYAHTCDHIHLSDTPPGEPVDIDALARFIYDNQDNPNVLHTDTYLKTAEKLYAGFKSGYKAGFDTQGAVEVRAKIAQNIYPFSAAKTLTQMNAMRDELVKDGAKLDYKVFRKNIEKLGIEFNDRHLKVEFNHCVASGQSGRIWDELQQSKDIYPCVEFETAGDSRVREDHRKYEGMIVRLDNPMLKWFWPPFDWECRCSAHASDGEPTDKPASGLRKEIPPMFRNNVGVTKVVFKDEHPYLQSLEEAVKNEPGKLLNYKNYNLKPMEMINRSKATVSIENLATKAEFDQWVIANPEIKMFDETPVAFDKQVIKKQRRYTDGAHWETTSNLADVLSSPSESYQQLDAGSKAITRTFLKHYSDRTIVAVAELEGENGWVMQTWYEWDGKQNQEAKRQGILLWLNRK